MFRTARERLGLSQNRVEELTAERGFPVSRSAVSEIERGRNLPGVESLVALCEVLQLDPREILDHVIVDRGISPELASGSIDDLQRRAMLLYSNGQVRAANKVYAVLAEQLETDTSMEPYMRRRWRTAAQNVRAWMFRHSGDVSAAEAAAKRALHFANGIADLQVQALAICAGIHVNQGLMLLAQAESEQAARIASAEGAPRGLSVASNVQGSCFFYCGRFDEAAEMYRRAYEFGVQAGKARSQATNEAAVGACLARLRHPSAARRRFLRALELARSLDDRVLEVYVQVEMGRLALLMEHLDEAEQCAATTLRLITPGDHPGAAFSALWLRHQVKRRRSSGGPDRHGLAQLKRLYPRVANSRREDAVREFRSEILGVADT